MNIWLSFIRWFFMTTIIVSYGGMATCVVVDKQDNEASVKKAQFEADTAKSKADEAKGKSDEAMWRKMPYGREKTTP